MRHLTDNEFDFRMKLILNKDKNGLKEIYNAYGRLIYQQMLSVVRSPQDAEDLTSDFFLRLWETADQYCAGTGHKRYIAVMAKNMALDFLRKRKRETYTLDDDEVYHEEQADSRLTDDEVIGTLTFDEALDKLCGDEKEIINLRLGFDMTFKEISKALGKPLGTVTWKYRQAISKLRKTVKEGSIYG